MSSARSTTPVETACESRHRQQATLPRASAHSGDAPASHGAYARGRGRPRRPGGAGRGRDTLAGGRSSGSQTRVGAAGGVGSGRRSRRLLARGRPELPRPQVRACGTCDRGRGRGHRRRRPRARRRRLEPGASVGAARRRRQLRSGDGNRDRALPGCGGLRRDSLVPVRAGAGGAPHLGRAHPRGPAGRADDDRTPPSASAHPRYPRAAAGKVVRDCGGDPLRRASRGGRVARSPACARARDGHDEADADARARPIAYGTWTSRSPAWATG